MEQNCVHLGTNNHFYVCFRSALSTVVLLALVKYNPWLLFSLLRPSNALQTLAGNEVSLVSYPQTVENTAKRAIRLHYPSTRCRTYGSKNRMPRITAGVDT